MSPFRGLSNKKVDNSMDVGIIDEMRSPIFLLIFLNGIVSCWVGFGDTDYILKFIYSISIQSAHAANHQ